MCTAFQRVFEGFCHNLAQGWDRSSDRFCYGCQEFWKMTDDPWLATDLIGKKKFVGTLPSLSHRETPVPFLGRKWCWSEPVELADYGDRKKTEPVLGIFVVWGYTKDGARFLRCLDCVDNLPAQLLTGRSTRNSSKKLRRICHEAKGQRRRVDNVNVA